MEFLYTIDPNAEEPIMLIDKHIGMDSEDGEGIMGDKFCRELMFLDTLNKSKINIWINSPGGVMTDAEAIVAAILKSKTKVDTHNIGMVASCAGPIFLAGMKRYMMDYAKFMMHPVSGGDSKSREAFENSTVTMLTSRSQWTEDQVRKMMNVTTWLNAAQCEDMGICKKESSGSMNRPYMAEYNSYKDFKSVVNHLIEKQKPIIMTKVTNKLQLVDGANEDAQVAAIEAIQNRATTAENKIKDLTNKLEESDKVSNTLKTEIDSLKNQIKEAEDKAKAAKLETIANTAKAEITAAVKAGKIENKAEAIDRWVKNYIANPEDTKAMIAEIPLNKKGPEFKLQGGGANEDALTMVAANTMHEVRNRLKIA